MRINEGQQRKLFAFIAFIQIIIFPSLSFSINSDVLCSEDPYESSVDKILADGCRATLEALDCKNIVPEDQIRKCDRETPRPSQYSTLRYLNSQMGDGQNPLQPMSDEELFKACATGFYNSGVESLSQAWILLTSPLESLNQAWNFTKTTVSYLWTEYERTRNQTGGVSVPINVGIMASNIAAPIISKVNEVIEEEVDYFQCLNLEIQKEKICKFLGDIFIPPSGGVAFLKFGTLAAKNFPNVARALTRLKEFIPAAIDEKQLDKYMTVFEKDPDIPKGQEFQESLRRAQRRYQHVIRNSNGAVVFHGSGSASLLSFTNNRSMGGLRSSGELVKEGKAPFIGELGVGSVQSGNKIGTNVNNLSTVRITDLNTSLDYLGGVHVNKKAYSLAESQRRMRIQRELAEEYSSQGEEYLRDISLSKIEIERQRQAQWSRLSNRDRGLVQENFPILYGLKPRESRRVTLGNMNGTTEVGLAGGADFDEITSIFVPQDRVRLVNSILEENNLNHIQISPIEPVLNRPR